MSLWGGTVELNVVGESLTRDGVFSQALAANPPSGWTHSEDWNAAAQLWDEPGSGVSNKAVFWTNIQTPELPTIPDAGNFSHSVGVDTVRHVKERHGGDSENLHGQIAVGKDDFARIPEIVSSPDGIRTDFVSEQGRPRVAYVKRFDDGVIFYMEEASKKRRDLRGISMRKYPSTIDTDRVLAMATNPNLYVRNGERAYGDDNADGHLHQDMTAEQAQFEEMAAAYGGREAYNVAKSAGKTELDYRQWVQVRTPAFKAWFGDWENDAANASKVVNPNTGEPLVVYHGTRADFDVFDTEKQGNGWLGRGFYFAGDKKLAKTFGRKMLQSFLNVRNPFTVQGDSAYSEVKKAYAADRDLQSDIAPVLKENGHDGVFINHWEQGGIFTAFNPNQIKSATANSGAFSADNDSILYQSDSKVRREIGEAADAMVRAFEKMGLNVRVDRSNLSDSTYVYADNPQTAEGLSVRISDHASKPHHPSHDYYTSVDSADFGAEQENRWLDAVEFVAEQMELPLPSYIKRLVTVRNKRLAEQARQAQARRSEQELLAATQRLRTMRGLAGNMAAYRMRESIALEALDDAWTPGGYRQAGLFLVRRKTSKRGRHESMLLTREQLAGLDLPAGDREAMFDYVEQHLPQWIADEESRLRADGIDLEQAAQFGDYLLLQDARGMFDRMGNTITLLKNADASTFIHEFGHFELETMSRIERDLRSVPPAEWSDGERQIAADFQTVLDWFGVKDGDAWAAMSLNEQREHHEKFARGMEAYLFEGKAPSEALRGVFSRVARLLKRIYQTLAGLNVELSDDIRGVFDRLIASDMQIAETEYVNGAKLLFADDAEFQAMDDAARREAEDELGRRALRDMAFARNARSREIRRLKKEYKADFEQAEMAARRNIMRQPVYRAWQLLTAKMTDEDRIDGNPALEKERARKRKALRKLAQSEPVRITGKEIAASDDLKQFKRNALEYGKQLRGSYVNKDTGIEIEISRSAITEVLQHDYKNAAHLQSVAAIPQIIENAVHIDTIENEDVAKHPDVEAYEYYLAGLNIDRTDYTVRAVVARAKNGHRYYDHKLSNIEKGALSSEIASRVSTAEISDGNTPAFDDKRLAEILQDVQPRKRDVSLDPSTDTLMTAIAKLGGLNKDELVREWGLDPKDKITAPVFGMPVLRKSKGRSIDSMAEALAEAGYLPTDSHGKADVRDLEERFSDGLSGRDWYSRHYVPREEKKAGEDVENPYALNAVRLDEASLDGLPADWADVLKSRGMTAKTGGMHPDIAAGLILDENGDPVFADGMDLVQALAEAQPPQEAIEDTARLNLLAEKGDLPTQADFEEAADLAVHNGMRARIIAAELNRLNDARKEIQQEAIADEKVRRKIVNEETNRLNAAVGTVSLLKQAAKILAKEKIEKMLVRDLRPSVFTRAEAAAAKSSEKAFKAGDIEEAAAHKRNQLIQNAMAGETLRTREEMRDLRRKIFKTQERIRLRRKRAGNPNNGVADLGYTEQISALLEYVGLAKAQTGHKVPSIHVFVREMEEAGVHHGIDPEYVEQISRKSWRDMTVEEMRGLADTVRQLEHLGRLKDRLLSGQKKRSYQAVRDELAATLDASAKAQGRKAQDRREAATGWQKTGAFLRGFYWGHLKTSTITRIFDNGQDGGAFFTHFMLPLKQAADREAEMQAEISEKLYETLKPLAKHTGRLKNRIGGMTDYQGLGKLTREQLFAVALNTGNAGNMQRLLDGSGWNAVDVERALSTLTAEEWRAVQGVWDLLESYRPQIAKLERRMTGVEPEWVEARPFKAVAADGTEIEMRGGYYPAKYDREGSGFGLPAFCPNQPHAKRRTGFGRGRYRQSDGLTIRL
ncbi:hypothetical protein [Kingella potus]|uniref:LPD3 domain-containing protein n=1 Tax=Kingella potus TaxID=265175 RepID=UPI003140AC3A